MVSLVSSPKYQRSDIHREGSEHQSINESFPLVKTQQIYRFCCAVFKLDAISPVYKINRSISDFLSVKPDYDIIALHNVDSMHSHHIPVC